MTQLLPNIHPGEVILEELIKPLGLSQNLLARKLGLPPRQLDRPAT